MRVESLLMLRVDATLIPKSHRDDTCVASSPHLLLEFKNNPESDLDVVMDSVDVQMSEGSVILMVAVDQQRPIDSATMSSPTLHQTLAPDDIYSLVYKVSHTTASAYDQDQDCLITARCKLTFDEKFVSNFTTQWRICISSDGKLKPLNSKNPVESLDHLKISTDNITRSFSTSDCHILISFKGIPVFHAMNSYHIRPNSSPNRQSF